MILNTNIWGDAFNHMCAVDIKKALCLLIQKIWGRNMSRYVWLNTATISWSGIISNIKNA